jgi:hypothetical protein
MDKQNMVYPYNGIFVKRNKGQAWWYMPIILALERLSQENCEFLRPCWTT